MVPCSYAAVSESPTACDAMTSEYRYLSSYCNTTHCAILLLITLPRARNILRIEPPEVYHLRHPSRVLFQITEKSQEGIVSRGGEGWGRAHTAQWSRAEQYSEHCHSIFAHRYS